MVTGYLQSACVRAEKGQKEKKMETDVGQHTPHPGSFHRAGLLAEACRAYYLERQAAMPVDEKLKSV
jgi:hypothetical protein